MSFWIYVELFKQLIGFVKKAIFNDLLKLKKPLQISQPKEENGDDVKNKAI